MNNGTYCDLELTGTYFNNKPLYKCNYCGLTVGLENTNTKILCFKKMEEISNKIHSIHTGQNNRTIHSTDPQKSLEDIISDQLTDEAKDRERLIREHSHQTQNIDNICSEEQIQQRLTICNSCEYYKNDSCLLCGCTVVREANYKNKLAHKDQKCPAGKWDIIKG